MYKVCLLGYGGIAQIHKNSYLGLEKAGRAKLVGICDIAPDAFTKNIAINISEGNSGNDEFPFNTYTDLDEMLAKEQPDVVDICLPTFLHKEKAVYLMRAGYHVFCEKPMALTYEDCKEMLAVSEETGKQIMIGQCLHFFAEYEYLRTLIADGRYGKPISGFFQRLSAPPLWSWENWYMDETRSGGCIQDLHIHDVDMTRYLFGNPTAVSCRTKDGYGKWDSAHSTLCYGDDFTVTVIGDWSLKNVPFESSYRVAFEKATIVDKNGDVTVYPAEGEAFKPDLTFVDGYAEEVGYFVEYLSGQNDGSRNQAGSAALTVKTIELLRESANQGGIKIAF